jgi:hypothetical protein
MIDYSDLQRYRPEAWTMYIPLDPQDLQNECQIHSDTQAQALLPQLLLQQLLASPLA